MRCPTLGSSPSRTGSLRAASSAGGGFEVLDREPGAFDGAFANLYADVLCEEIPRLERALRPGAWFALSGCSEIRAQAVLETISRSELRLERMSACGRWRTFVGARS